MGCFSSIAFLYRFLHCSFKLRKKLSTIGPSSGYRSFASLPDSSNFDNALALGVGENNFRFCSPVPLETKRSKSATFIACLYQYQIIMMKPLPQAAYSPIPRLIARL